MRILGNYIIYLRRNVTRSNIQFSSKNIHNLTLTFYLIITTTLTYTNK